MPQHVCGDHRKTFGSQFSPSTLWFPSIQLSERCLYPLFHTSCIVSISTDCIKALYKQVVSLVCATVETEACDWQAKIAEWIFESSRNCRSFLSTCQLWHCCDSQSGFSAVPFLPEGVIRVLCSPCSLLEASNKPKNLEWDRLYLQCWPWAENGWGVLD